jgi:NADH-quinone oxidoreductase subunit E
VSGPQGIWMDTPRMGGALRPAPPLSGRFGADAQRLIARYPQPRSALLPLLYLAQAELGYVSPGAIGEIAALLDLTKAEVTAVSTFYTMFKRQPQGKWLVSVCTQPSCALAGGMDIKNRLEAELGVTAGGTTDDGISIEEVECLCACDGAPVVSVNYENYERSDADAIIEMVRALRAGGEPPEGARGEQPQDWETAHRRLSGIEGIR